MSKCALKRTCLFICIFICIFIFLFSSSSSELKLREAFVNQTQEFYDFTPQKLTSDSEANVRMINNWVSSQTKKRIPELVDFFDESTEFVLLNAVYFMGQSPVFIHFT